MKHHHTHSYLLDPPHKVTIDLVGLGGTGSQVLNGLARISEALQATGHPGLHVRAWDPDIVTESNIGRQLFSTSDIGLFKASVLITRVNRFFGFEWQSVCHRYKGVETSNIILTCVDTAAARMQIGEKLLSISKRRLKWQPTDQPIYWLDIGNLAKTGQVLLGTIMPVLQPKIKGQFCASLKPVTKFFNLNKVKEEDQGPSCSLAEALTKQDLFINSALAQFGCNLLWKLFREGMIRHQGCYVNLETLTVNPIKI